MSETPTAAAALDVLERLAALVCEGDEATVDEIRDGLAACIDQTLLDPLAGPARVAEWAQANAHQGFATLCVQPCYAGYVAYELAEAGSATRVCTVLAFPQGQASADGICFDVALALGSGVSEIDMVMNVGAFLEGSYDEAFDPIVAALRTIDADDEEDACACGDVHCDCDEKGACTCGDPECDGHHECACSGDHDECDDPACTCHHHDHGHGHDHPVLKVIIETGCLTSEQICRATDIVSSLGVDFVKTCTGFGPRGATVEDVRLMCATVEPGVQVKAAGGIRTLDDVLAMLEAGATRVGTSRGDQIMGEFDALVAGLALAE